MLNDKLSYQTNFTGIKYSNNPLSIDPNSFSTANNVYLNKYNALISRPPLESAELPAAAYSDIIPTPIHLKIISTYNLDNEGVIYVVYNTITSVYSLRYKSPSDQYSEILHTPTIAKYSDFLLVQYKQYYILFTVDGARALDISAENTWVPLANIVDIPITLIQTGNEKLTIPGNQLTNSYKSQFNIKSDSDDTIYNLPEGETAEVIFPSQPNITYDMIKANEYTRDRLLHKLIIPRTADNTLISMADEKIAIAHADRVDISLDYGNTFETIVYPTVANDDYKNTASLSDDGQAFFYVHTNGVYRLELGTRIWTLIEVSQRTTNLFNYYDSMSVERELTGPNITSDMVGANYCHFVNPERFAFVLAHQIDVSGTMLWVSVIYVKGMNLGNVISDAPTGINPLLSTELLSSISHNVAGPISIIGAGLTTWSANPYLNRKW